MYFYADRTDRAGNRLLTSYGKEAQATKYGGPTAQIFAGEKYLDIREDGSAKLENEGDLLVRTLMVRPAGKSDTDANGKFVVYAKIDGRWQPTTFRYSTYAKANSAVKSALITMFEACAVIETDGSAVQTSDETPPFEI